MLISVFAQVFIILLLCPAIWLVVKYDGWPETIGIGLGVLAVPFIGYSALRHGQWGFIIPCIVFLIATFPTFLKGIENKWRRNKP